MFDFPSLLFPVPDALRQIAVHATSAVFENITTITSILTLDFIAVVAAAVSIFQCVGIGTASRGTQGRGRSDGGSNASASGTRANRTRLPSWHCPIARQPGGGLLTCKSKQRDRGAQDSHCHGDGMCVRSLF